MAGELRARVCSEHGRLRKVLVHTPGKERLARQTEGRPDLRTAALAQLAEIQAEHAGLKARLVGALGAGSVLELTALLREIFDGDTQRRRRILAEILGESTGAFLAGLEAGGRALGEVEPEALVEALVVSSSPSLLWVRDPAMCTPAGLIVHEMAQAHRRREPALLRAILRHHPAFAEDSVFLDLTDGAGIGGANHGTKDATVDWNLLDGGNTLVLGPGAIAVGAPWPGALEAFALESWARRVLLAETDARIDRVDRIYLVHVPLPFGHLDAVFNPFAPGCALAMPYLFGGPEPISRRDIGGALRDYRRWARSAGSADPRPDRLAPRDFEGAGQVETWARDPSRPGEITRLSARRSFVEQLVEDGWLDPDHIAWIGGCREDHASPTSHLGAALREQGQQAGNLLVLGPDEVVISDHNPGTRRSMERVMARAGRTSVLRPLPVKALAACYGGPRCLTLPLLRSE